MSTPRTPKPKLQLIPTASSSKKGSSKGSNKRGSAKGSKKSALHCVEGEASGSDKKADKGKPAIDREGLLRKL